MKYLIDMIEHRRFYIEADTEDDALDWAATHTAFDVQNEVPNESYSVNYEERCIGQTDENVDAIKIN